MGGKILSIDDDPNVRILLQQNLENLGYIVETAKDGVDGLRKALIGRYDLILVDVMMPHMDGYELCDKLNRHSQTREVPIIVITAKQTVTRATVRAMGATEFLIKPFRIKELRAIVERLLPVDDSSPHG